MRVNSLHLQNFRQHAETRVEFDSGITGIIGPNGAGKTTILEAIAWALYGQSAARGTRESIRFNRAGSRSGVRVELDFDLGRHRYRVIRGLTTAEVYLDGATAPIATGINGVTELLQRRIGMTREEFFNTYFTGQKELNVMAAMKPTQRAQFLSRVLGYERLRTAQDLARQRRNLLAAEIQGLRAGMPDAAQVEQMMADGTARLTMAERRLTDAERDRAASASALAAITPRWEAARAERERIQRLDSDIVVELHRLESLDRETERAARELAVLAEARAKLDVVRADIAPLPALADELRKLDRLCREEGKRQTLTKSVLALQEELGQLRERAAKLETAPQVEAEAQAALAAKREELAGVEEHLDVRRTDWVRDRQEAETKRDSLRQQWLENKQQLDKLHSLGEQGICPTCSRPLGPSYHPVVEELQAKVETLAVDGRYYKERLEQLKEPPEDVKTLDERRRALVQESGPLERRIARAQAAMQELTQLRGTVEAKERRLAEAERDLAAIPAGFDAARHQEVQVQVERLRKREAEAKGIEAALAREGTWTAERDRVAAAVGQARARVERLKSERSALTFSETDYATLEGAFLQADGTARAAAIAFAEAEGDAKAARSTLQAAEAARRQLEAMREKLEALARERRLHEELDRAFTELRQDLNERMKPELAELASAFLEELTSGRYAELELDESYNIVVLEDGIQKPVISGGEEDLANLVLRLAISQMIAERAGQTFSLLILDEVFGSLDESRRSGVVDLLRRLQDRFEQIILITHIESVREGVDRVISVRLDEETGTSVVERSLDDAPEEAVAVGTGTDAGPVTTDYQPLRLLD